MKQAGRDLDISKQANRGIYNTPNWIQEVKLQPNGKGDFVLSFPAGHSLKALLEEMQRVPDYVAPTPEEIEEAEALAEELLDEVAEPLAAEALEPPPPPPTMDPATPAFKRAALVKDDAEKPKFDFMSNRPTPRKVKPVESVESVVEAAKPVPEPVAPVAEAVETAPQILETSPEVVVKEIFTVSEPEVVQPRIDFKAAMETSATNLNGLHHDIIELAGQLAERGAPALREALRDSLTSLSSQTVLRVEKPDVAAKWQQVPLTDLNVKFAVSHYPLHS